MTKNPKTNIHTPVLAEEILFYLDPKAGESYVDFTAGYGGHAGLILKRTKPKKAEAAVLVDRDQAAIDYLSEQFKDQPIRLIQSDFLSAARQLADEQKKFDLILADLGLSSLHLDEPDRGFAFAHAGPLDMRMDQRQTLTAQHLVNTVTEKELVKILRDFGEEPHAERIAHAIVAHRPLHTTRELAELVRKTVHGRQKIHPATKTFQAIRIAVNQELELLEAALPIWLDLLAPGGRIGVISFHSLEDRLVKNVFAARAGNRYDADLRFLTKKPVSAKPNELALNPRARSAKLRAVAKINNERSGSFYAHTGKK